MPPLLAVTGSNSQKKNTANLTCLGHFSDHCPAHCGCLPIRGLWRKEVPWQILTAMQPVGKMHCFSRQRKLHWCTGSCQYAHVWPGCQRTLSIPSADHRGTVGSGKTNRRSIMNLDGMERSVRYFKPFSKSALNFVF